MSLIHFELLFVCDVRWESNFNSFHVDIQLSHHRLLEKLFFSHWIILAHYFKQIDPKYKSQMTFLASSDFSVYQAFLIPTFGKAGPFPDFHLSWLLTIFIL